VCLQGLPRGARSWLLDEESLTERLIRASGGAFRVERLSQGWQRPLLSERRLLGLPQGQWALVREVALRCFDEPWVYARSVIPAATLNGRLRRLRRLQDRSLGALLFQQAALRREQFELALLPPDSHFIHPDLRQGSPAWARRSCFRLFGHTLLVSEVFLERFQAR
jgi:chorismate--pyruvate lyase